MALIKTTPGIIDIRGTCGGDVYKRDSSGLHITSYQRTLDKNRTTRQQEQNDWYCALKRAEYSRKILQPTDQEPRSPKSGFIYKALDFTFNMRRTLTNPDTSTIDSDPSIREHAEPIVALHAAEIAMVDSLTMEEANRMIMKIFARQTKTFRYPVNVAEIFCEDALTHSLGFWLRNPQVQLFTLASFYLTALTIVYEIADFFTEHIYRHFFGTGESLFYYNGIWYWCNLIERLSQKMFRFQFGPSMPFRPLATFFFPEREGGVSYYLDYFGAFSDVYFGLVWNNVYHWGYLNVLEREEAFEMKDGTFLCCVENGIDTFYDVPIGWHITGNPFNFIDEIYDGTQID